MVLVARKLADNPLGEKICKSEERTCGTNFGQLSSGISF
jgi:hypothetical protein